MFDKYQLKQTLGAKVMFLVMGITNQHKSLEIQQDTSVFAILMYCKIDPGTCGFSNGGGGGFIFSVTVKFCHS